MKLENPKSNNPRPRPPLARCWVITSFRTKNFTAWKTLDLVETDIRYLGYQLEQCPDTGKIHIQAYVEFYKKIRLTQLKQRLGDEALHAEIRRGCRVDARNYAIKEDTPWFDANYPQWAASGARLVGTDAVEIGRFATNQGTRSRLDGAKDLIDEEATELEIFEAFPDVYLRYSTGIRRARALKAQSRCNKYKPIEVNVIYGDPGSGKTRSIYEIEGEENCYIPTYSASANKYWFDGYDGHKVLVINEFYGQCRTSIIQNLWDNYRIQVETKGGLTVSNWDKIYVTSNVHPKEWYHSWETVPKSVEDSIIRRINTITKKDLPPGIVLKTWEDIPSLNLGRPVLPYPLPEPGTRASAASTPARILSTPPTHNACPKTATERQPRPTSGEAASAAPLSCYGREGR